MTAMTETELNRWPRCMRCDGEVEYYYLEHKFEQGTVIVHARCHGKQEGKEIGRMSAELMMQPMEFFGQ